MSSSDVRGYKLVHELIGWTMSGCFVFALTIHGLEYLEARIGFKIVPDIISAVASNAISLWLLLFIPSLIASLIRRSNKRDLAETLLRWNLWCLVIGTIGMILHFGLHTRSQTDASRLNPVQSLTQPC